MQTVNFATCDFGYSVGAFYLTNSANRLGTAACFGAIHKRAMLGVARGLWDCCGAPMSEFGAGCLIRFSFEGLILDDASLDVVAASFCPLF